MGVQKQNGLDFSPPVILLSEPVLREEFFATKGKQAAQTKAEKNHGRRFGYWRWPRSGSWE
jgi:hypothetical protein